MNSCGQAPPPRLKRDDVLPPGQHNPTERDHVHFPDGVTNDRKGNPFQPDHQGPTMPLICRSCQKQSWLVMADSWRETLKLQEMLTRQAEFIRKVPMPRASGA
jgi:hypothetical protein